MASVARKQAPRNPRVAAIYPRVSTGPQEDGTSLETQESACRRHATAQGYAVAEDHVYREVHTGTELWERPQLTRLRAAIRQGDVDVLIVYAIDRLARDPVHLGVIITEADHAGVGVEFVTEPLDNTPEGQLIRFVRGYAAKVEHEKIRERTIRGKRARVQGGKIHRHGVDLYGYRRDKEAGIRVIHESEAMVVRQIFAWVADEGLPIREVVRRLNESGTAPASAGKMVYREVGRQPHWGKGQVKRILDHPAYKGDAVAWRYRNVDGKGGHVIRPESEWLHLPAETTPALVSPPTWSAAQARLEANRSADAAKNNARPYLLRGLIHCAVCGRRMRASPERGTQTYRCSSRETPAGPCGGQRVRADDCEAWVWDQIDRTLRDPSTITAAVEKQRIEGERSPATIDRAALERMLVKIEKQQERLIGKFREGDDDSFPWELIEREIARAEREKKDVKAQLEAIDRRLADERAMVDHLDSLASYCERVGRNLERFDFADRRLALEALGVKVSASGGDWRLEGGIPVGETTGTLSHSSTGPVRGACNSLRFAFSRRTC